MFQRVMVGLAMDQPLGAIFFPGILDGLTGRLGLTPLGVVDPPTSARAGVSRRWAATLWEAVMRNEGRDIDLEQVTPPPMWCTLGSTRTMTWIYECGGLMT